MVVSVFVKSLIYKYVYVTLHQNWVSHLHCQDETCGFQSVKASVFCNCVLVCVLSNCPEYRSAVRIQVPKYTLCGLR